MQQNVEAAILEEPVALRSVDLGTTGHDRSAGESTVTELGLDIGFVWC